MSPDGTTLLDSGAVVYTGPTAEGTKIFKLNGYYYISIPEGGVSRGWQTVLRSRNIYGPYEKKVVLEKGTTDINGPHQGAFVATPEGQWWFYHFQSDGAMGRGAPSGAGKLAGWVAAGRCRSRSQWHRGTGLRMEKAGGRR